MKEGQVDEFLQYKGGYLQQNAIGMEQKAVRCFAAIGNPGISVFVEKMKVMVRSITIHLRYASITKRFTFWHNSGSQMELSLKSTWVCFRKRGLGYIVLPVVLSHAETGVLMSLEK